MTHQLIDGRHRFALLGEKGWKESEAFRQPF
jgi:hypothetical protein